MKNAIAFSNNDVITIAWSYGEKPIGCLGFAIYRIDNKGNETVLPNKATFPGMKHEINRSSERFPIQKFYWKDVYARLVAEQTGNYDFSYKIVPMEGPPGNLTKMTNYKPLTTNTVTISAETGLGMKAYFNRGIISTQRVANYIKDHGGETSLKKLITDYKVNTELRDSLSGGMVEALMEFMDRVNISGGHIYAGLYELSDAQLIEGLCGIGNNLSIVLSNSAGKVNDNDKPMYFNEKKQKWVHHQKTVDHNDEARKKVANNSKTEIHNRIMPSGHIGHNKFLIYVNNKEIPEAVLLGSTNWTSTGLCTQTNNTMVIEDRALAERYLAYWKLMEKDTLDANGDSKKLQGPVFRAANAIAGTSLAIGSSTLESWFAPNTPKARSSKKTDEKRPVDMQRVVECINGAENAILFLAFYPGAPSLSNWIAQALKDRPELFVRGMVTHNSASESFFYELMDEMSQKRPKGTPPREDYRVGAAQAFNGTKMPKGWIKEILTLGHAIIHDKVIVIDPFSPDCIVITGSNNLGYRASYNNDENMVIIKGNQKLALAYATHVLDVYDHFNYRIYFNKFGKTDDGFLKVKSEEFLGKYFNAQGQIRSAQLNFWMQGTEKLAQ